MKAIKENYLITTLPRGERKATAVLQVAWPHLIGRIYVFNQRDSFQDVSRQLELEGTLFVPFPERGVIVSLDGTLKPFDERKIDNFDQQALAILYDMGEYYYQSLPGHQQRHLGLRFKN